MEDSYRRLIAPAIEREIRNDLTEKAEDGAIKVFKKNLEQLLMQPPIVGQVVLGWDPAFRTGCKLAVVDATGKVLDTTVIYPTAPIRWLVDDCVKFVEREIRRGNKYDAIIMDPPSYGRGPKGEIWKIEDAIHPLIKLCTQILSDEPLFFLVNSYTTGLAPAVLTYMLATELKKFNGTVDSQEIGLPVTQTNLVLPCGASGRWESKK